MLQVAPRAAASDAMSEADKLKGPPNLLWRVASAMMYLIPWIDTIAIGREIYHNFPVSLIIYFLPGAPARAPARLSPPLASPLHVIVARCR